MYPKTKWLYQRVQTSMPDNDKLEDFTTKPPHRPFYLNKFFLALAIIVSLGSLTAIILYGVAPKTLYRSHKSCTSASTNPHDVVAETGRPKAAIDTPRYQHTCGNSSADAHKNGCIFDRLTVSWQHPSCSQAATTDFLLYAGDRPYKYWLDREGTQLLDDEELAHLNEKWYWSTKREHLAHCAFVILRFYKAMGAGEKVDDLAGSTKHAHHCMKNFLGLLEKSSDWDDINTTGNIQYLSC